MSTVIRPVVSKKNEYYISKHRYYELVHFCLQYPEWRQEYAMLAMPKKPENDILNGAQGDPTSSVGIKRAILKEKMEIVETAAKMSSAELWTYIFKSVTEGYSYGYFAARRIPCGKDLFYSNRRKFFFILDVLKTRKIQAL